MTRCWCFCLAMLLFGVAAPSAAWSAAWSAAAAASGERPARSEVWDLALGSKVEQLPDAFIDYACGSNGGPPAMPLNGFGDFRRCRPEPSGFREVYFRYDDELEYWAKANNLLQQMAQFSGTKTYGFPVIVSALIDDQAVLRGIRLVSDPRGEGDNRDEAYLLRNFLTARFGREGWACEDLAAAEGETPVAGIFVKQRCRKQIDERTAATLATRHLRKPGQSQYDPQSGRATTGQFESAVRFELVREK
jgi:hypothetical protein